MDLTQEIDQFLKRKSLCPSTIKVQRSALLAFNKWLRVNQPNSLNTAPKSYENYVRNNKVLKPKTLEQHTALISRFVTWTISKGNIKSYSLEEQALGNPALGTIALPVPTDAEITRICSIVLKKGNQTDFKNAFLMLLAVTCNLTPETISDLSFSHLYMTNEPRRAGKLSLNDGYIYFPKITTQMCDMYLHSTSYKFTLCSPLFPKTYKKGSPRMEVSEIIKGIDAALRLANCTYGESIQGDPQFAIAQHFKLLSDEEKMVAASFVVRTHYDRLSIPSEDLKNADRRFFS